MQPHVEATLKIMGDDRLSRHEKAVKILRQIRWYPGIGDEEAWIEVLEIVVGMSESQRNDNASAELLNANVSKRSHISNQADYTCIRL